MQIQTRNIAACAMYVCRPSYRYNSRARVESKESSDVNKVRQWSQPGTQTRPLGGAPATQLSNLHCKGASFWVPVSRSAIGFTIHCTQLNEDSVFKHFLGGEVVKRRLDVVATTFGQTLVKSSRTQHIVSICNFLSFEADVVLREPDEKPDTRR